MSEPHSSVSRFALISVSDKSGITEFAQGLREQGFTILSTGGSAATLREAGIDVTDVSDHTGFPEIMDGRVKTLHPRIHGGILGRDVDKDVMHEHGITPIELVVVNLYPFEAVTARADCEYLDAIENIDIGGPAMVRAAAKNHARVGIVTHPSDYASVLDELRGGESLGAETRARLAARAFAHTAAYDSMIAAYLERRQEDASPTPRVLRQTLNRASSLRYGENPHQAAALYRLAGQGESAFRQWQGKELSFNNLADADAAQESVAQFGEGPACIIVKHANPCGGAEAGSLLDAYERAYATDPVSAFGGIIAFNARLDAETAARIVDQQFVEVIIAPGFDEGAREALAAKPNVRVLETTAGWQASAARLDLKMIAGGVLAQQHDCLEARPDQWCCVTRRQASVAEWADLVFAWKMVRMVKSNAIVYARDRRTLGVGAGQMSRVDSARIAAWKASEAGLSLEGSVMASDAFFPFRDSIDAAAGAGVTTIIQPGGSMRDEEVIAAADEHAMTMIFTGVRHFRH